MITYGHVSVLKFPNDNIFLHTYILLRQKIHSVNIDFCIPISFLDRKFIVEISVESSTKENSIDVFTDGSKSKVGAGGGIYIP